MPSVRRRCLGGATEKLETNIIADSDGDAKSITAIKVMRIDEKRMNGSGSDNVVCIVHCDE